MLRYLLKSLLRSHQAPTLIDRSSNQVVLYAQIGESSQLCSDRVLLPAKSISAPTSRDPSHRERLLSMKLEHTKLCSPHRCRRLRGLGIITAGDLATANPDQLAGHFADRRKAAAVMKAYRRAIRLAAAVPGMMPRDAMLLVNIHRRSVRGLASESPSTLHRDLERYAESTKGRSQLRGRRVPSPRRLKRWITQCESLALGMPLPVRMM